MTLHGRFAWALSFEIFFIFCAPGLTPTTVLGVLMFLFAGLYSKKSSYREMFLVAGLYFQKSSFGLLRGGKKVFFSRSLFPIFSYIMTFEKLLVCGVLMFLFAGLRDVFFDKDLYTETDRECE